MKITFIAATAYTIYLMKYKRPYCTVRIITQSYDSIGDEFPHWKILVPGAIVATLLINIDWTLWDLTHSFTLWLEAVAFFP
jgi:hypothetical protein